MDDKRIRANCVATFAAAVALVASVSCDQDFNNGVVTVHEPGGVTPVTPSTPLPRKVIGLAELSFKDMNTTNVSSSIRLATSVDDLERLRSGQSAVSKFELIEIDPVVTGEFSFTPANVPAERFVWATYAAHNVRAKVIDSLRDNVSFVPVATSQTFAGSPVRSLQRGDGTAAAASLALQISPSPLMAVNGDGELVAIASDILTKLTADDRRKTSMPTGASSLFDYSFGILHRSGVVASRADDGVVTFSFRMPGFVTKAEQLSAMSIFFVIVNDSAAARTP